MAAKRKTPRASKGLGTKNDPRTNKPYTTQTGGKVTAKMMSDMMPGAKKNKMFGMLKRQKNKEF